MAYYAALISVVQSLEKIINRDKYPKFLIDKQQIVSVFEKLSHLLAILEDCCWPKDEEAADCLERRIRDAAYQVQDILEAQDITKYKISNLVRSKGKTHGGVKTVLPRLLISKLKRAMPRQLQVIEEVKKEVDSIVEEVSTIKIKEGHTTQDLKLINYNSAPKPELASLGDSLVGFEELLTAIKDQLCGEPSKLEVVSLVGMGGIGKTTLATSIFHDELIMYRFDRRAWVTVSQNYHPQKVLVDIMNSMKLSAVEEELLPEHIYKHLKGRRYLIIVDDIWDTIVWDDVRRIFPDDNNGSRIILTTRLLHVAIYANRFAFVHQMQFLNEDQSWNLFREKVFGQENCPQELEVIGRLIAKNCRGLPLAIVVVAGLLSKVNKATYDWEDIARNVSSTAAKNDEHFSKILSLSYNQLPHHLKPCFLYIGGFPEDYRIPISELIKLWVAEGFLKPNEFKSLEEIGEEYLEDLVKRNLVLITKKKFNDKFMYCSVHDVLRDLCVERAHYENFLHVVNNDDFLHVVNSDDFFDTKGTMKTARRLYIHHARSRFVKAKERGSNIGSVLCFHDICNLSFVSGFIKLRVLNALSVGFYSFPVKVLELSRLRYLALGRRGESKFKIPPRISKLKNLQTLIVGSAVLLSGTKIDVSLPIQIWKMSHLRHVIVGKVQFSSSIPFACILENLQTLSRVVNFRFTNKVIQMIPHLKKLELFYSTYEPVKMWEKFCLYNLARLCQLETLDIYFSGPTIENLTFPKNFAFPHKLKELSIEGCQIPWKDMTAVGSLPNLQVLKLRDDAFVGGEWETIEGELPRLKFLLLEDLDLKYWQVKNTHFPCLEHLKIILCLVLEGIPLEIGDISTLELIEVYSSRFVVDSVLQIKEEQRDLGNDVLQVHVHHSDWSIW